MKSVIDWFRALFPRPHFRRQDTGAVPVHMPVAPSQPSHTAPPASLGEKEPVLVRGRRWKNTEEDRWDLHWGDETPRSSAVDDLIKGLGRSNRAEMRRASAESLGRLGALACPAIPALLGSSTDVDATVRQAALDALDEIDPAWAENPQTQKAIPSLVQALKSWSPDASKAAFRTLGLIGLPAVATLNDVLLNGEDTIDRVYLIQLVSRLGPDAGEALPGLTQALKSQFLRTRIAAAEALCNFGPRAEMAIPALIANLTDPMAEARQAMAACLCQIGAAAEPAIPALAPLLADRKQEVREAAASALKCMGAKVIPAMIEIVQTRDVQRMKMWTESMFRFFHSSPAAPNVIADLRQVMDNLSWTAYDILEEHASLEAAQENALQILGELGAVSQPAVPTIAGAVTDGNPRVKLAAIHALSQIGAPAKAGLPTLNVALADPNPQVRVQAAQAIAEINAKAAG